MAVHIAIPIVAGVLGLTAVGLRLRAVHKTKLVGGNLPPAKGSGSPTAASKAIAATIPAVAPPAKQKDGTVSAAELAKSLAAEKIRAAQLTADQLAAIEQNTVPGKQVAPFDGNGSAGGTPMPLGTFKAGDIIPTDHVSINIRVAALNLPPDVVGDLLIRATQFNTDTTVRGISIDPRFDDPEERDFPMNAVTGVGPVVF